MDPRARSAYLDQFRDIVERSGWAVQGVGGTPPWAYTIGLHERFGHPELAIVGLPMKTATLLLNLAGERVREGERLPTNVPYLGIAKSAGDERSLAVEFVEVDRANVEGGDWFNTARAYYGHAGFVVLQMVWPDPSDLMPWDRGFTMHEAQPVLGTRN